MAEFFDVGLSRSLPWKRRPQAARLLAALSNPQRGFNAVGIGEDQRAFYGNQFGLTFPLWRIHIWLAVEHLSERVPLAGEFRSYVPLGRAPP